jgi:hypothetical protein
MKLDHYRVQWLALVLAVLNLGLYAHGGNDYDVMSAK